MSLSARVEDYLEAILDIEMSGEIATVTRLASNLGVTKATVTVALKRLAASGLLDHERYGDVFLTGTGRERALVIYRRHEFLTDFFVRILGFSRERAQQVSCAMEHEIDETTEKRLAAFTDALAHAERHNEGWLVELQSKLDSPAELPIPLCLMPGESCGSIARITAHYELRNRLNAAGFLPGAHISEINRHDGSATEFTFRMNDIHIKVGLTEASAIWLVPDAVPAVTA